MRLKDSCVGGIGIVHEEPDKEGFSFESIKKKINKENFNEKKNEIMGFIEKKIASFKGENEKNDNEYSNYFNKKKGLFEEKPETKTKTYEFPVKPSTFTNKEIKDGKNNGNDLIEFEERPSDFEKLYESSLCH